MDFLNINEVLNHLDVKKSDTVAEFGCGTADFTLALAKRIDKGKLYALDIQEEKLSVLKNKIASHYANNVKVIKCDLEAPGGSTLRDDFLNIVLIPNVLFGVENKYGIMQEAKRVLKVGGQLLVIDWLKVSPLGPKENFFSVDEVKKMAGELGLAFKQQFASGDYHYALLFIKT